MKPGQTGEAMTQERNVMSDEELSLTLQYINAVRARCGLTLLTEIPKGAAPDTADELSLLCPLARALPQSVIGDQYVRTAERQVAEALSASFVKPLYTFIEFPKEFVVDLPDVLLAFVNHYDLGWLPQFIS
ncbi:MAG: hypothetical protein JST85_18230 [Acidobacteria bacterium]|nr:hypothetical protein [Acidobacteriota bacterium]